MSDRTREASKAPRPTTVLDPLRPAVVVRRRVYDATLLEKGAQTRRAFTTATQPPSSVDVEAGAPSTRSGPPSTRSGPPSTRSGPPSTRGGAPISRRGGPSAGVELADEEDERGPPSSINVARALASLRSDELQRVEDLVRADEEVVRAPSASVKEATPPVQTLTIGKTIPLSELADRVGVPSQELTATLVTRGFYALTARTVLPRETARVIAEMFGWRVEDAPPEAEESAPAKSGTRSRIATRRKVGVKTKAAKPKSKVKVKAKAKAASAKPAKRRLAR